MFNRYIWNNYLDAGGKHIVHIFAESLTKGITERYVETIKKLRSVYCPDRAVIEEAAQQLRDLARDMAEDPTPIRRGKTCAQGSALESLYNEIDAGEDLSENHIFSCFAGSLDYFTTSLSISSPDVFIPYYFKYNFNIFEKIAHEFGIRISPIPYKKEYRKRFFYYADICRSLHGFREMYGLSPYELCAFLYDFAPNYLGGSKSFIIENLPEPKGFFCNGGSENDFFIEKQKIRYHMLAMQSGSSGGRYGDNVSAQPHQCNGFHMANRLNRLQRSIFLLLQMCIHRKNQKYYTDIIK